MAYTFENRKDWTEEEYNRVVSDSMFPILSTFEGSTEETSTEFVKLVFSRSNYFCLNKEDGYLLAIYVGKKTDAKVAWQFALIGKDTNGSKSYIYNQDWSDSFATFIRSEGINEQFTGAVDNSPLGAYETFIRDRDAERSNVTMTEEEITVGEHTGILKTARFNQ
tara:strand:- start:829 stop:1323 length:495 start_codon:yes stop_codon:yes gene_type:complete